MLYTVKRDILQNGVIVTHQNYFDQLADAQEFYNGSRGLVSVRLYDQTGTLLESKNEADEKPKAVVEELTEIIETLAVDETVEPTAPSPNEAVIKEPVVDIVETLAVDESVSPTVDTPIEAVIKVVETLALDRVAVIQTVEANVEVSENHTITLVDDVYVEPEFATVVNDTNQEIQKLIVNTSPFCSTAKK